MAPRLVGRFLPLAASQERRPPATQSTASARCVRGRAVARADRLLRARLFGQCNTPQNAKNVAFCCTRGEPHGKPCFGRGRGLRGPFHLAQMQLDLREDRARRLLSDLNGSHGRFFRQGFSIGTHSGPMTSAAGFAIVPQHVLRTAAQCRARTPAGRGLWPTIQS